MVSEDFKIIVPKKQLKEWKLLLEHGDYAKIELVAGIRAQYVGRLFRKGQMKQKTYNLLLDYFESKKAENQLKKDKINSLQ